MIDGIEGRNVLLVGAGLPSEGENVVEPLFRSLGEGKDVGEEF